MDVSSIQPTWSYVGLTNLLKFLYAASTAVGAVTVHLFTAGPSIITPQNVVGDFTEAAFTGYADVVITPSAPPLNVPFDIRAGICRERVFTCTTAPVSPGVSVLGYYVTTATGGPLLLSEIFPEPVAIVNAGDFVNLAVAIPLPFQTAVAL